MIELIIHINNGKLINPVEFKEAFRGLKDGKHLVMIKDMRKRSLSQNAYYWGVCVPMVRKGLYEIGFDDVKTDADAHEMMKQLHLKRRMINNQTGDIIDLAGSSAKLTTPEFSEYLEQVCRWASEYLSINIPSPNEQLAEFKHWEEEVINAVEV